MNFKAVKITIRFQIWSSLTKFQFLNSEHTRQIAGKNSPLIPVTLLGLKEKKISTKIDFCIKTFLSAIYSDVIS